MRKTVVMVGMMGAGKTAVGTAVARSLGVPFVDSDAEIERASNLRIAEIFDRNGEDFFRRKESQVLSRLLEGRPTILSTGGGAWLSTVNRDIVRNRGVAVWLRAELDLLWSRVRHKTTRPLLRTADPKETLRDLCHAREPAYAMADLVVQSQPGLSVEEMADRVIGTLATRPDILRRET